MATNHMHRCKNHSMNASKTTFRPGMHRIFLAFALLFSLVGFAANAQDGAAIFSTNCATCHKINDKLVGPALKDVHKRHDEAYLLRWIKNSQAVIKSGDKYADSLYKAYNETPMPAFELPDNDIKAVIAYIKSESEKAPAVAAATGAAGTKAGDEQKSDTSLFLYIGSIMLAIILAVVVGRILTGIYKLQNVRLFRWNNVNGVLMLLFLLAFFGFVFYQMNQYRQYILPESSSAHGPILDRMMWVTFGLTFFVFLLTQTGLMGAAFLYRGKPGKRGYFYPDNKKLEFFWTLIPAIVLTFLILDGSRTWLRVLTPDVPKNARTIEVFGKQFEWKVRYAGADQKLGHADYRLIGTDPGKNLIGLDAKDATAKDDIVSQELHLQVDEPILMKFRSQDVIHSAYLPYFRVQMNVVPGMPTQFYWTPTKTTNQMRDELGDNMFNYEMACNKICGASHYGMRLKVIVESAADYKKWMADQKPYIKPELAAKSPETKPLAVK